MRAPDANKLGTLRPARNRPRVRGPGRDQHRGDGRVQTALTFNLSPPQRAGT